jgi:DDE superfamily endonuclease
LFAKTSLERIEVAATAPVDSSLGFTGLDPDPDDPVIITGYKATRTSKATPAQRHANQALSAARAPVEHGFSDLRNWRILTRLRLSPANATMLLRALLVLTRQHAPDPLTSRFRWERPQWLVSRVADQATASGMTAKGRATSQICWSAAAKSGSASGR